MVRGIALFVLILVGIGGPIGGTIYARYYPVGDAANATAFYITPGPIMILAVVSGVCVFATAVFVASFLTCGCCCLGKYKLKSNVNTWAIATLVTLCLVLVFEAIGRLFCVKSPTELHIYFTIESVLLILALVFARRLAWGGCCGVAKMSSS